MENIGIFFTTILTSLVLENAVFARALGLNQWVNRREDPLEILKYGGLFTWVCLFSTIGSLVVIWAVAPVPFARYLRAPGFLLVTILVYLATYYLAKKYLPQHFENIKEMLPIVTFNTAMFSVFYIVYNRLQGSAFGAGRGIAYALGTGAGYTFALLVIFYAKKRLHMSPIPKSLRGAPILLIYLGLLSLAIYGMLGYGGV